MDGGKEVNTKGKAGRGVKPPPTKSVITPPTSTPPTSTTPSTNHVARLSGNVLGMKFMARAQEAQILQEMKQAVTRAKTASEWTLPVDRSGFRYSTTQTDEVEGGGAGVGVHAQLPRYGRRSFQHFNAPIERVVQQHMALEREAAMPQLSQRTAGKKGNEVSMTPKEMAARQKEIKGGGMKRKASNTTSDIGKISRFSLLSKEPSTSTAIASSSSSPHLDTSGFMKPK